MPIRGRNLLGLIALALAAAGSSPVSAQSQVRGRVFLDRNGDGAPSVGEPGIGGVAISDQFSVVVTAADGTFQLTLHDRSRVVSMSMPNGYRAATWWYPRTSERFDFAVKASPVGADFAFVHASDTHISPASLGRTQRLRAVVDSLAPAFAVITGDLVRDALRVGEGEAMGYYTLFQDEARRFRTPLYTVPGNHEIFGVERSKSGVRADHPLYGREMYHHFRGPDYYSFNVGGIHFVGLNTIDVDDSSYYGHVDDAQLAWLASDLAVLKPTTPVVTFNHIPFFTAVESANGYQGGPPAPSLITVQGVTQYRHTVANAREVLARIAPRPYPMALGGHMHVREQLVYAGLPTRFEQAAAVVGPSEAGGQKLPSGVTLYRVRRGRIDAGTFIPLP